MNIGGLKPGVVHTANVGVVDPTGNVATSPENVASRAYKMSV